MAVQGEDAHRAAAFARQFLDYHRIPDGVCLRVQRALPAAAFRAAFEAGRALTLSEVLQELRARPPG